MCGVVQGLQDQRRIQQGQAPLATGGMLQSPVYQKLVGQESAGPTSGSSPTPTDIAPANTQQKTNKAVPMQTGISMNMQRTPILTQKNVSGKRTLGGS